VYAIVSPTLAATLSSIRKVDVMTATMSAREARKQFANLLGRVHSGGETVIVERSGKEMVAVIPIDLFRRIVAERDARFAVLDKLRQRLPDGPEDEVMEDVAAAVACATSVAP
jgi:prevent-host-death family protein